MLGIGINEVTPEDAQVAGLRSITGVKVSGYSGEDSPAQRAGLEPGDIITKVDGKPVDRVSALQRAVRAHGNAVEYVPIALILLGLAEGMGMPGWLLHLAGLALTVGRGLHGWYFLTEATRLNVRVAGMLLTVAVIALLSVGLVFHALARLL